MKISLIDSQALHLQDLDLSIFEKCGEIAYYELLQEKEIIHQCKEEEIIITNKVRISSSTIEKLSKLKLIIACSTGTDQIDIQAANKKQIIVCNVPYYSGSAVAQHTINSILCLANNSHRYAQESFQKWSKAKCFTCFDYPVIEVKDKTLGIIGFGNIGKLVSKIALALGMKIQALQSSQNQNNTTPEILRLSHKAFFSSSDFISLHCPLTEKTEKLINAKTLALMKPNSFLINTARGKLIDEIALLEALKTQKIAGAALDVLSEEPPPNNHPLLQNKNLNLFITPHTAWISKEARQRLINVVAKNIESFKQGNPINIVN